jgi:hypothetical protein
MLQTNIYLNSSIEKASNGSWADLIATLGIRSVKWPRQAQTVEMQRARPILLDAGLTLKSRCVALAVALSLIRPISPSSSASSCMPDDGICLMTNKEGELMILVQAAEY